MIYKLALLALTMAFATTVSILFPEANPAYSQRIDNPDPLFHVPGVELRYDPDLHCNGDDTLITIKLSDPSNGTPVVGRILRFFGEFRVVGNAIFEGELVVRTNRQGIARVRAIARDEQDYGWVVSLIGIGGGSYPPGIHHIKGTCDFDGDPANKIRGHVFEDTNGNGVQDEGERPVSRKFVSVSRSGQYWFYILPHSQRTTPQGEFNYAGVPLTDPPDHPLYEWHLCFDDKYSIVSASVNGLPPNSVRDDGDCFDFFIAPGDNVLSVGVTRRP